MTTTASKGTGPSVQTVEHRMKFKRKSDSTSLRRLALENTREEREIAVMMVGLLDSDQEPEPDWITDYDGYDDYDDYDDRREDDEVSYGEPYM
jgi:hypothetical protein